MHYVFASFFSATSDALGEHTPPRRLSAEVRSPTDGSNSVRSSNVLGRIAAGAYGAVDVAADERERGGAFIVPFGRFFGYDHSFVPSVDCFTSPLVFGAGKRISTLRCAIVILSGYSKYSTLWAASGSVSLPNGTNSFRWTAMMRPRRMTASYVAGKLSPVFFGVGITFYSSYRSGLPGHGGRASV